MSFDIFLLRFVLSGYQDSNLGPPAPKAGALTGLRYTPNSDANIRNNLQFTTICADNITLITIYTEYTILSPAQYKPPTTLPSP